MTTRLRLVLAEKLRYLMETTPLTSQRKVGDASGVAQSTVGRILAGDVSATLDNVEAIANAFRVSPVNLLSPTGAASGTLATLFEVCEAMPHEVLAQVLAYARYQAAQTAPPGKVRKAVNELNFDRQMAMSDAERGAIQRSARTALTRTQEFNKDAKQAEPRKRRKAATRGQ